MVASGDRGGLPSIKMQSNAVAAAHWFRNVDWHDDALGWDGLDDRVTTAWLDIGDPGDPHRPLVMVVRYAPGITVKPHSHASDYASLVVEGDVVITGQLHGVGSIRLVAARTVYGPLVTGDRGTTLIDVFTDRNGLFPLWAKEEGAERERHEQLEHYLQQRLARLEGRPPLRARHQRSDRIETGVAATGEGPSDGATGKPASTMGTGSR